MRVQKGFSTLQRPLILLLGLIMSLVLTACPRPLSVPLGSPGGPASVAEADRVTGTVDFGRRVQADLGKDVMPGATVSVIDVDSGATLSTARTDAQGNFVLTYSNTFRPQVGKLYYFEAIKGLDAGTGSPNAVGADLVRVRTIASFGRGGWVSLTSARVGFHIPVTPMTTALSIVVSLRAATSDPIDPTTLFGSIRTGQVSDGYPDTLTFTDGRLVTMVRSAYGLVVDAFSKDRDPVRWIQLSSSDATHFTVVLPDVPFTLLSISPLSQVPLGIVTLIGSNYDGAIEVYFQRDGGGLVQAFGPDGGAPEVSSDRSRIRVKVPPEAVNGQIELRIKPTGQTEWKTLLSGQDFLLATMDGHSVVDLQDRVYAANYGLGTIVRLESISNSDNRSVVTLLSGLEKPGALSFGPGILQDPKSVKPIDFDFLYVAVGGVAPKVLEVDLRYNPPQQVTYSGVGGVPNPSGMAFDAAGTLYITDAVLSRLYVLPGRGKSVSEVNIDPTSLAALSAPRGLAFGPNGKLYVANSGTNEVLEIALTVGQDGTVTGKVSPYVSGLSAPWGVAFDPRGVFYVSNNQGNSVYRRPVTSQPGEPVVHGPLAAFATVPTPAGIDADASGYLFVADRSTNGIYQINSNAERRQIGIGISYPVATWAGLGDKANDRHVYVLTEEGRLLKVDIPQDKPSSLSVYAEGLGSSRGLTRDGAGNFYTHRRGTRAIAKIYAPDGSNADVLGGLNSYRWSAPVFHDGRLFMRTSGAGDGAPSTLHGFDMAPVNAVPGATYMALMRNVVAIAQDRRAVGANASMYFVLQDNEVPRNVILKVERHNGNSATSVPFLQPAATAKLTTPTDLVVDGLGKLWVADAAGKVVVFDETGAFIAETAVPNPTRLTTTGTKVVVSNYQELGDVRFFDQNIVGNTIHTIQTLSGLNKPQGVAFAGGNEADMYVNVHGGTHEGKVLKVSAYADKGEAVTLTDADLGDFLVGVGSSEDIEFKGSVLYFLHSSRIRSWDGVNLNTAYRAHYSALRRLSKNKAGQLIYVSANNWVHTELDDGDGSYSAFTAGLTSNTYRGDHGESVAPLAFTAHSWVSFSRMGAWGHLVETRFDGTSQRNYKYDLEGQYDLGAVVADENNVIYFTSLTGGYIAKWEQGHGKQPTVLNPRPGEPRPYTHGIDHVWGLAYYKNKLYQPIRSRHLVREVDTATGAAVELPVGLVSPEL